MIEIQLAVMAVCSALFWLGGFCWLPARRFIMPSIIAIFVYCTIHQLIAFGSLLAIGALCLGYGDKSPLRHIFGNGWGRGVWGLISAIGFSIFLFVSGHIFLPFWIAYLALNFILENALKNINQKIGDPIIGVGLSCIVLLIH